MNSTADLRYPIGKLNDQPYTGKEPYSDAIRDILLGDIKLLPQLLENAILNLDAAQLATPYKPGGWTINQVVHHVADSHMNAYTRFKLALTEEDPVIKPYDQDLWADLADTHHVPVNMSLTFIHALHARWYTLMKFMTSADWQRSFYHPEQKRLVPLWEVLAMYAWHGRHHTAQVENTKK